MNEPPVSGMNSLRSRFLRMRDRVKNTLPFASGIVAALLAILLYQLLFPATQLTQSQVNDAIASAMASATPRPAFSAEVYRIIQPSVVLIEAEIKGEADKTETSLGSGVIIDNMGDILTSLHVVENSTKISITFADGTKSEGSIASAQPENDIAVLSASVLPQLFVPATLGNPNSMQVGDEAYVVGNPFGLYSSMSAGVISGLDRTFRPPNRDRTLHGLIQFDAAANPGNSGGPLLNRDGFVIGIVTGIVNPTNNSFFVGIGFAVPIGTAAGGLNLPPY